MKVKCQIDNHRSTKKGLKITLHLDEEAKKLFMPHLFNFEDMPLDVDFNIDAETQKKRLSMISEKQRAKIYALFKDIADYTGDNAEAVKINSKHLFLQSYGYDDFSLSDCSVELAKDFITFLVSWCFVNGVYLTDKPKEILEDIETYLYLCVRYKRCCVCGKEAFIVGPVDGNSAAKMALCQEHKLEAENKGWKVFGEKYHVKGIVESKAS